MKTPINDGRAERRGGSHAAAGRAFAAFGAAALAAFGAATTAHAAHDGGVVRTVGAGFTGLFRALDLLVASPAMLLPIGTRSARAGLASALVAGACAAILFDLARALVTAVVPAVLERAGLRGRDRRRDPGPLLVAAVAAAAVLTGLLSPAWQSEASAPGGAVLGALLVLATVRAASAPVDRERPVLPELGLLLGLAASYEPLVGAAAALAIAPHAGALRDMRPDRTVVLKAAIAFALGLLPLALGACLLARPPELALHVPLLAVGDGAPGTTLRAVAVEHVGLGFTSIAAAGAVASLLVPAARRASASLLLVVAAGALAVHLGQPAGPDRFAPVVLAAIACAFVLAATVLGALVLAIARLRVAFAEVSAALVVVLELVLPIKSIDETTTRRDARVPGATAIWNDVAWGAAPPAAVVLVPDRGTMRRVASARAAGEMRGDLLVVPAFDVQGRAAEYALLAEPRLAALYRDIALGLQPEELSLARLGSERAVLATFDPRWDRALSRHLVPIGLTARFEAEPRGLSERKQALEAFTPAKERLLGVSVARKDVALAAATAALLRGRAIAMAATGERDVLSRALDDLRAFAPEDAVGAVLVRRFVTNKGAIDVHDLTL